MDVFDPLREELQDCFNALKEVNPDQVYSSRRGKELGNVNNNNNEECNKPQASTSTDETPQKKKPKSNSNFNIFILGIQ